MLREAYDVAYQKIRDESLLPPRLLEVYGILFDNGPMTIAEVYKHLASGGFTSPLNSISPRFAELHRTGAIKRMPQRRICKVTEQKVFEWDVTNQLPTPGALKRRRVPAWKIVARLKQELEPIMLEVRRPENVELPGSVPISIPLRTLRQMAVLLDC